MFVYDVANAETCPLCSPVHRSAKAGRATSHSPGTLQPISETDTHAYAETHTDRLLNIKKGLPQIKTPCNNTVVQTVTPVVWSFTANQSLYSRHESLLELSRDKNQQKGSASLSLGSAVVKLDAPVSWHQILNETSFYLS